MSNKETYQVQLIDGSVVNNLTYEEANEYFFKYAGSVVRPWPVREYKAP